MPGMSHILKAHHYFFINLQHNEFVNDAWLTIAAFPESWESVTIIVLSFPFHMESSLRRSEVDPLWAATQLNCCISATFNILTPDWKTCHASYTSTHCHFQQLCGIYICHRVSSSEGYYQTVSNYSQGRRDHLDLSNKMSAPLGFSVHQIAVPSSVYTYYTWFTVGLQILPMMLSNIFCLHNNKIYKQSTIRRPFLSVYMANDDHGHFRDECDSYTIISTSGTTRRALQKFITDPYLLQQVTHWVYANQCKTSSYFPHPPLAQYQIARFLQNFESPIVSVTLGKQVALACVDTGASGILCSFGYFSHLFPTKKLDTYVGLPYRQASGEPLPILGQFETRLVIGDLQSHETIIVMKSSPDHKELLLGWRFLRKRNISVSPDGLFLYPTPPEGVITNEDDIHGKNNFRSFSDKRDGARMCELRGRSGNKGAASSPTCQPPLTLAVYLECNYTVKPLSKHMIQCRLQKITQEQLCSLQNSHMCFSSELVEPNIPILDLTIYPQYIPANELFRSFPLLYNNKSKQSAFLFKGQHVAHCIKLEPASTAQFRNIQDQHPGLFYAYRLLNQNDDQLADPTQSLHEIKIVEDSAPPNFDSVCTHDADPKRREQLIAVLKKYPTLFSSHTWSVGQLESTLYLRAKSGAVPQQQRFIPHPRKLEKQCMQIIQHLLDYGLIIENPDSAWRSNILFLLKPAPKVKDAAPNPSHPKHPNYSNESPQKLPQQGKITSHDNVPGREPGSYFQDPNGKRLDHGFRPPKIDSEDIPLSRIRLVLDFSMINAHLKRTWPSCVLPKVEDIFNYCYGMKVLSRLDITQSFWSKKVNKSMMDLSTFYFMGKAYSMTRMCQGCSASSEVFQSSINKVIQKNQLSLEQNVKYCGGNSCPSPASCKTAFCGKPAFGCFAYIDDIFIVSRTEADHFLILDRTLAAFAKSKLKVKLAKTDLWITKSCDILGFHLDLQHGCISPAKKNIQKVMNLPPPANFKKLQKFIGAVTFYCHLLPDFSSLLAPLTDLLKSTASWEWTSLQQDAFTLILRKMASQPTLYILDPDSPIYAVTDGCLKKSISYCQLQWKTSLQTWCPVRFQSHKLSAHMVNYSQTQIEALSLVTYASENYPLLMSHTSHVFSDARSLSFISRFRYNNLTIWRYHLLLSGLPLIFHWLPSQSPLLVLCDLFTREKDYELKPLEKFKEVLNKRISPLDIAELQFLDFSRLPSMNYEQVLLILDAFYKILESHTPDEIRAKFKSSAAQLCFPDLPDLSFKLKETAFHITPDFSANVAGGLRPCQFYPRVPALFCPQTDILPSKIQDPDSNIPVQGSLPKPRTDCFQDDPTAMTITMNKDPKLLISPALERLQTFFPASKIDYLIKAQSQDEELQNLFKNHSRVFLKIDGIICHKKQFRQYTDYRLCWPKDLNVVLLQRAHRINNFYHIRKNKLRAELNLLFHIRGFDRAYQQMNCKFCDLNKQHQRTKIPFGVPFLISRPRLFLAMDICYINTSWAQCCYLTVVDITCGFFQAYPLTKNATANDIYQILFTRWVGHNGYFLAVTTDNARNFNNSLAADLSELCHYMHIKISPFNSKANVSEKCQRYANEILRAMSQAGFLTERNFDIALALTALLWNTTTSPALQMSPAEYFFFSRLKTNHFTTFSSLLYDQSRYALTKDIHRITDLLQIVRLKKWQKVQQQREQWQDFPQKMFPGQFHWVQIDREKKGGWKLREKYSKILYKIVTVAKTYVISVPVSSPLELLRDPFVAGDKIKKKLRRVHKDRVKICNNPEHFLDLEHVNHHLDAAATVLTDFEPVRSVLVISHPGQKDFLPSKQAFNLDISIFSPKQMSFRSSTFCGNFSFDSLFAAIDSQQNSVCFQSQNSWLLFERKKVQDDYISKTNFSEPATCTYGLTQKYKDFHKKLLDKKIHITGDYVISRQGVASKDGRIPNQVENKNGNAENIFLQDIHKYIIKISRDDIAKVLIQKINESFNKSFEDSSSCDTSWHPVAKRPPPQPAPPSNSRTPSSLSRSSTSSFNSANEDAGSGSDETGISEVSQISFATHKTSSRRGTSALTPRSNQRSASGRVRTRRESSSSSSSKRNASPPRQEGTLSIVNPAFSYDIQVSDNSTYDITDVENREQLSARRKVKKKRKSAGTQDHMISVHDALSPPDKIGHFSTQDPASPLMDRGQSSPSQGPLPGSHPPSSSPPGQSLPQDNTPAQSSTLRKSLRLRVKPKRYSQD